MSVATADEGGITSTVSPRELGRERLVSLDVFRGATIAAMLLVNDPGSWSSVYAPLLHAPWHGWTPTDLIFPFFLFIVGITTALSLRSRRERGARDADLAGQIVKRGLIIVVLGLILAGFPFFAWGTIEGNPDPTMGERIGEKMSTWRFPGVLQRIGVCYLVAGLIWLKTTRRAQIAITAALLFGYWILSTVVPVPGSGLLGAATLDRPSETLAAWLDRAVFGAHVWSQSKTWDPEGLLSTLPAIATVFLGIFAGELIGSRKPLSERLSELFAWGVGWTIAGAVWGWFFPINKNLWTSSFTLFTAGLGALVLGLCIWMIEVRGWKGKWTTPFIVFGVNPILAYVGAGLMAKLIYSIIRVPWNGGTISLQAAIYQTAFLSWLPPKAASLAFAISFVLVWLAILWPLWKKGVYVKV